MSNKLFRFIAVFIVVVMPGYLWAYSDLPTSGTLPDVVHLRKDCANTNPDLKNCADNMSEMLNWVWSTKAPSVAAPVLINVGPGTFVEFNCNSSGNVTLRGSGRDNTKIISSGIKPSFIDSGSGDAAVNAKNCSNLVIEDLTIEGGRYGIRWMEGGNSVYSNVLVTGNSNAWWDFSFNLGASKPQSTHYWFSSVLRNAGGAPEGSNIATLFTYSADHWLYGCEISAISDSQTGSIVQRAIWVRNEVSAEVRLFGSVVRVGASPGTSVGSMGPGGPKLIGVRNDNVFHMHGGIISVDATNASNSSVSVKAISSQNGFSTHTPGVSFIVNPKGSGIASRISGEGIESPYQWPRGTNPPEIKSTLGSDLFVEIDCTSNGDCDSGTGTEPHLMIYSENCTATLPWFDSTRGKCRGEL
ncbi:hypothetical protein MNBD_GAMMA15-1232 [hydrothermal vent metagenome]|uniref:Uncharacterized protein n=1 Tax=hydrothermal vent metagenome TaxID=652676 RepID=A0A3B0YV14_9ZZZZ